MMMMMMMMVDCDCHIVMYCIDVDWSVEAAMLRWGGGAVGRDEM